MDLKNLELIKRSPDLKLEARKVLIIEDDVEIVAVFNKILRSIDPRFYSDWVTSAEQAVGLLEAAARTKNLHPYDLILADVFLDGARTGLDVWRLCKEFFPTVPLVVTSAFPFSTYFEELGKETLRPPFLQKPFVLTDCREMLEGYLR